MESNKDIVNNNISLINKDNDKYKDKNLSNLNKNINKKKICKKSYSWHHDTTAGRKILSELTDMFYMD